MYAEEDLLPISALQHYVFCPRQCGLIHLEQVWAENRLTAQGRQLHDRAHEAVPESRGDLRVVRSLRLCSHQLGLTGQADVLELRRPGPDTPRDEQTQVPGLPGNWTVFPVEYKRGRPKHVDCDRIQLCAQAMCLEEMLHVRVPMGQLFYAQPRRREAVALTSDLRESTRRAAQAVHAMIQSGVTPPPTYSGKCRACSLLALCMPKRAGPERKVKLYLKHCIDRALGDDVLREDDDEDA